jgi:hypothetical protein
MQERAQYLDPLHQMEDQPQLTQVLSVEQVALPLLAELELDFTPAAVVVALEELV